MMLQRMARFCLFAAFCMPALFFYGCSGDDSSGPSLVGMSGMVGTLRIVHEKADTEKKVGGEFIDSVEIVGADANGTVNYGPVREAFAPRIERADVPRGVATITVDYLRNGGYPLKVASFKTAFDNDGVHVETNPTLLPHDAPASTWSAQLSGECLLKVNNNCFRIRGMCYSPAPISYDSGFFPALGDLFWDSILDKNDRTKTLAYNWYSLWGKGQLNENFSARNDLDTIRNLGVNAIRVYAIMSRQPGRNKFSIDKSTATHFTHKLFLDQCYNNGVRPLYVLIGIPLSTPLFQKGQPLETDEQKFWEDLLDETTRDLSGHPAVLGFTIMNELDAVPWSHVTGSTDGSEKSDYFYSQSIKYAKVVKKNAPGKLVGWAIHDCPQILAYAAQAKFTSGEYAGNTYLVELARVFDFWGVNTYQSKSYDSVLGSITVDKGFTYSQIPQDTKKPVIFTELGWPATGRTGNMGSKTIYYDDATGARTAEYITRMFPLAYGVEYKSLFAGAFYFEFSDEWWKSHDASVWNKTATVMDETPDNTLPNLYNDQEGYGLYGVRRGTGKQNGDPVWCDSYSGPCLPVDVMEPRMPLVNALKEVYMSIKNVDDDSSSMLGANIRSIRGTRAVFVIALGGAVLAIGILLALKIIRTRKK